MMLDTTDQERNFIFTHLRLLASGLMLIRQSPTHEDGRTFYIYDAEPETRELLPQVGRLGAVDNLGVGISDPQELCDPEEYYHLLLEELSKREAAQGQWIYRSEISLELVEGRSVKDGKLLNALAAIESFKYVSFAVGRLDRLAVTVRNEWQPDDSPMEFYSFNFRVDSKYLPVQLDTMTSLDFTSLGNRSLTAFDEHPGFFAEYGKYDIFLDGNWAATYKRRDDYGS